MDFIKLVHKKDHKLDNRIIFFLVLVFVIFVFVVTAIKLLPGDKQRPLLFYLPNNETNFFYHLSDKKAFRKDILGEYKLFDIHVADSHVDYIEDLLGPIFLNVREIVWFRVKDSDQDHYLVEFSHLQKKSFKDLEKENPNLYFARPEDNILLISPSENIKNIVSEPVIKSRFGYDNDKGISIYWTPGENAEFLDNLTPYLSPYAKMVNIYRNQDNKLVINLYDYASEAGSYSFGDYKVPQNLDLVFAFSKYTSDSLFNVLENDLIRQVADSLPYYNLNSQIIDQAIITGGALMTRGEDWLVATPYEMSEVVLELVDYYQVEEVKKTLQDGTLYTELVASPEPNKMEHQLKGQSYYQISNLFVYQEGEVSYISNSEALIQEIVDQNRPMSDIWSKCLEKPAEVSDFLYLNTVSLPDGPLKDYLSKYSIETLNISSYPYHQLQICL